MTRPTIDAEFTVVRGPDENAAPPALRAREPILAPGWWIGALGICIAALLWVAVRAAGSLAQVPAWFPDWAAWLIAVPIAGLWAWLLLAHWFRFKGPPI
jgi:hypothetical protein